MNAHDIYSKQPIILHDCEELQVLHFPTESELTLVTFDIMHAKANGKEGFALKLARRLNLNFYAVVPKRPDWYPTKITHCVNRGLKRDQIAA
jgi:hypothetical protein